jgi:hypothetical protein
MGDNRDRNDMAYGTKTVTTHKGEVMKQTMIAI